MIDQLPDELLVAILLHVRDYELRTSPRSTYHWAEFARVNRRWRSVMLNAPCLWTRIVVESNVILLDLFMKRSRESPLEVNVYSHSTSDWTVSLQISMFRIILEASHRLRHLRLQGVERHALDALIAFMRPMPLLESLCITTQKGRAYTVLALQFPNLMHLRLRDVMFEPSPFAIGHLKNLELSGHANFEISQGLLGVLANSPALEILLLVALRGDFDALPNAVSVELPHLKSFRVDDNVSAMLGQLFLHLAPLIFPTSAEFSVDVASREEAVVDEFFDMMFNDRSLLRARTQGATRIHLHAALQRHHIEVGHPGESPLLSAEMVQIDEDDVRDADLSDAMRGIAKVFAGGAVRVVELHGDHTLLRPSDCIAYLRAFPHLERLAVRGRGPYNALFTALQLGNDGTVACCPRLQELEINNLKLSPQTYGELIAVLEVRNRIQVRIVKLVTATERYGGSRFSRSNIEEVLELVDEFRCTVDGLPVPLPEEMKHLVWVKKGQ